MNRVFFIILLVAFLVVPISINNVNDDGISYFELAVEISENLFQETKIEEKKNFFLSENQKQLIREKLQGLSDSNNNLFNNFEEIQNENLKEINEYIALNRWQKFSTANSGIKGIYLSGYHFLKNEKIDPIKDILSNTVVNTIVLDVKTDNGHLLYDSEIPEVDRLKNERIKYDTQALKSFKEDFNIYLIGRVVAFQDPIFTKIYPQSAIIDSATSKPFSQNGQYFLDPGDSKSREYILNVALEACLLGFDEIQFDYIRYPDSNYPGLIFDYESNFENRTENINSFLQNATDLLHDNGCLASADIFGYVLNSKSDNGIGQYLETIVNTVDFISPMVYPSHYSKGSFGYSYPNNFPYEVVTSALNDGLSRGVREENLRPFLQGFWHSSEDVRLNIKAAEDKGLDWIIWNNSSVYEKDYFSRINS
jgi:hypothetical protein|tara:strand:- start:350 stop:1618 length:1269 start_codon:yes stop_codon:yes gene_type:complete